MIEARSLTKKFGRVTAVDGASFDVRNGEIVGFIGPNGAGKTTTIRMLVGVLRPTSGTALIDGHDIINDKVEASKRIGWVPEIPTFEQDFRAIDYFKYMAGYHGISGAEAERLARELFKEVGLESAMDRKLKAFSQGMRKRFALAVSLIGDPANFLFDEVLNGLDPEGIAFFRDFALRMRKEGRAVLFSSHILSEVQNLADRVVIINRGRIIAVKSMEEVLLESRRALRVSVANPDDRLEVLLSNFGRAYRVGPDTYEVIGNVASEDVVEALVKAGYRVRSTSQVGGLEEYFFRLIGGEAT